MKSNFMRSSVRSTAVGTLFFTVLFFITPVFVFAEDAMSSTGSISPEVPSSVESASSVSSEAPQPAGETTTTSQTKVPIETQVPTGVVSGAAETEASPPRPIPVPAVVPTQIEPVPDVPIVPETESVPEGHSFPILTLLVLVLLAAGAAYGAFKFMRGDSKGEKESTKCNAIQIELTKKQGELALADSAFSLQEKIVEALKKKINEKVDEKKDEITGTIQEKTKDALLGTKEEGGGARKTIDVAEKAKETYDDISSKLEKAKELLEILRSKRDGLNDEVKTFESRYATCIANVSGVGASAYGIPDIVLSGTAPTKALIFDWAGVLTEKDVYWMWVEKNVSDPTLLYGIDDAVDRGEISMDEFLRTVARASGKKPGEVWPSVKEEMILNDALIALIRKLKKRYKIGLLSNYVAPLLRPIITEHGLWDLFDEYIISSEHGLIKPDPKIFKKMLDMLKVKPEEAMFMDDRQNNVDAAKKLGINAVLFTTTEQLIKDLKKFGI